MEGLQQGKALENNAQIKAQNNVQVHIQNKSMNLKGLCIKQVHVKT